MPVTYTDAVKNLRMTETKNHFNNGTLVIMDNSDVVLSTHTFATDAGTISGSGVWTLILTDNTTTAVANGTAVKAELREVGGTADLTGLTVGTSGTDIVIGDTAISSGQEVTMTSGTITHSTGV